MQRVLEGFQRGVVVRIVRPGVVARCGISSPVTTPAKVACTPDFSTQTQTTTPSSR